MNFGPPYSVMLLLFLIIYLLCWGGGGGGGGSKVCGKDMVTCIHQIQYYFFFPVTDAESKDERSLKHDINFSKVIFFFFLLSIRSVLVFGFSSRLLFSILLNNFISSFNCVIVHELFPVCLGHTPSTPLLCMPPCLITHF